MKTEDLFTGVHTLDNQLLKPWCFVMGMYYLCSKSKQYQVIETPDHVGIIKLDHGDDVMAKLWTQEQIAGAAARFTEKHGDPCDPKDIGRFVGSFVTDSKPDLVVQLDCDTPVQFLTRSSLSPPKTSGNGDVLVF